MSLSADFPVARSPVSASAASYETAELELEPDFRYQFFYNVTLTSAPPFPTVVVSATRHTYHLGFSDVRRLDLQADDN